MKVLVAVKRVVDHNVPVHVKADGSGIDCEGVRMSLNPFDEHAIEEAVRMRESGIAREAVAVTVGPEKSREQLVAAIAMGADRGILVRSESDSIPLNIAKYLRAVAEREKPDLIITGKQATDDDACQTPQMLAALLGWPQGIFASRIVPGGNSVTVTRETDYGQETLELKLPAVISVDLNINLPRKASLQGMLRAKKAPLEVLPPEALDVRIAADLVKVVKYSEPTGRKRGLTVQNAYELIERLRDEAGVIR